jgi:hypothetical protein
LVAGRKDHSERLMWWRAIVVKGTKKSRRNDGILGSTGFESGARTGVKGWVPQQALVRREREDGWGTGDTVAGRGGLLQVMILRAFEETVLLGGVKEAS